MSGVRPPFYTGRAQKYADAMPDYDHGNDVDEAIQGHLLAEAQDRIEELESAIREYADRMRTNAKAAGKRGDAEAAEIFDGHVSLLQEFFPSVLDGAEGPSRLAELEAENERLREIRDKTYDEISRRLSVLKRQRDELQGEKERLREALREIKKGQGPFSRDALEHAENTIEHMKEVASDALNRAEDGQS